MFIDTQLNNKKKEELEQVPRWISNE